MRDRFDGRAEALRAFQVGLSDFVLGGISPEEWSSQVEFARGFPGKVHPVAGMHPVWVAESPDTLCATAFLKLTEIFRGPDRSSFVASGELGLDFRPQYRAQGTRQRDWFRKQLLLAIEVDSPLVLHVVRAHREAIEILKELGVPRKGGMVHSFSGDEKDARAYVDLGLHLSISGGAFRGEPRRLQRLLKAVPEAVWLFETDSPDQALEDCVGPWNSPAELPRVVERWALLNAGGPTSEELLTAASRRARKLFGLPEL